MRIAVIADHVHAVKAPFAGGLETMTWYLSRWLSQQGHEVTLFARSGSEVPGVHVEALAGSAQVSDLARHDVSMPDGGFLDAHHAYLDAINRLRAGSGRFDLVQLHGLHHLPVAMSETLGPPVVLTLHSPPTPWLETALRVAGAAAPHLTTVSRANAALWAETIEGIHVIPNGVDLRRWRPGAGTLGSAIWTGRMVPEKAPHLAIQAAELAGIPLRLAGPIEDGAYFASAVAPHLGEQVRYEGQVDHDRLCRLIGESRVLIQTPQWDEPFCLAAAEALACGTPVAAFNRGGLPEVLGRAGGVLAEPGDVADLARATTRAAALSRAGVRSHADAHLSLDRCGRAYEALYRRLLVSHHTERRDRVDIASLFG